MRITCESCGNPLEVNEVAVGQHVLCPYCGVKFTYRASREDACVRARPVRRKRNGSPLETLVICLISSLPWFIIFAAAIAVFLWTRGVISLPFVDPSPAENQEPQSTSSSVEVPLSERLVKVICPYCKRDHFYHYLNSKGEKIVHEMPGMEYCIGCQTWFPVPEKYR